MALLGQGDTARAPGSSRLGRATWIAKLQTQEPLVGRIKSSLGSRRKPGAKPGLVPKELTAQQSFGCWRGCQPGPEAQRALHSDEALGEESPRLAGG